MGEMATGEKRREAVHTSRRPDDAVDGEGLDRTIAHGASTYGNSDCGPEDFTYRPECRAEVVEDGR